MKQTILFLAFLALSFSCPAQKSWVSVRINDFNRQHTTTVDPVYDITNKGWLLLPSVGYYRIFDDTWGLGCEFGYAKTTTDQDGITTFPATDNVSLSYVGSRVTQYYVCPSVFDLFTLDRYRLTAFPVLPRNLCHRHEL